MSQWYDDIQRMGQICSLGRLYSAGHTWVQVVHNKLPNSMKQGTNAELFKTTLKGHLLDVSPYNLEELSQSLSTIWENPIPTTYKSHFFSSFISLSLFFSFIKMLKKSKSFWKHKEDSQLGIADVASYGQSEWLCCHSLWLWTSYLAVVPSQCHPVSSSAWQTGSYEMQLVNVEDRTWVGQLWVYCCAVCLEALWRALLIVFHSSWKKKRKQMFTFYFLK